MNDYLIIKFYLMNQWMLKYGCIESIFLIERIFEWKISNTIHKKNEMSAHPHCWMQFRTEVLSYLPQLVSRSTDGQRIDTRIKTTKPNVMIWLAGRCESAGDFLHSEVQKVIVRMFVRLQNDVINCSAIHTN